MSKSPEEIYAEWIESAVRVAVLDFIDGGIGVEQVADLFPEYDSDFHADVVEEANSVLDTMLQRLLDD